jgi:hypothetical protein
MHVHVGPKYIRGNFDKVTETTLVVRRAKVYDKYVSPSVIVPANYTDEVLIPLDKIDFLHYKTNPV